MWLKPLLVPVAVYLDDKLGYGTRNPNKKWWLDLEFINGVGQPPVKGTNERDLDLDKKIPLDKHVIAYYPASTMPPPDCEEAYSADRKTAMAQQLETPEEAQARRAAGGAKPLIYVPTPPRNPELLPEDEPADGTSDALAQGLGQWRLVLKTPMGEKTPIINITESQTGLVGTITEGAKTDELLEVSAYGDKLKFTAQIKSPMGKMQLAFNGTVDGDSLSGKVKTPMGSKPFTGERI